MVGTPETKQFGPIQMAWIVCKIAISLTDPMKSPELGFFFAKSTVSKNVVHSASVNRFRPATHCQEPGNCREHIAESLGRELTAVGSSQLIFLITCFHRLETDASSSSVKYFDQRK